MGLLTKFVLMKWNASNKRHYVDNGYIFTKMGDEFEVRAEDLSNGANVLVDIKCDGCSEILIDIKYQTYKRYVHDDGSYYCNLCARNGYKKWISFFEWCYLNLSQDIADYIILRWDYNLNIDKDGNMISPKDVSYGSGGFNKKGYWFKCLDHPEHGSELKNIYNFTKGENSIVCNKCNTVSVTHPMLIRYLIDKEDSLKYSANSKVNIPMRCPTCGLKKEINMHQLSQKSFSCERCNDGKGYPNKFLFNFLEQIVDFDIIKDFEIEKTFDWLIYEFKNKLHRGYLDGYFELNGKEYGIEMDGWFHTNDNKMSGQTKEESKFIDDEKDRLCSEHGVKVIRIDCIKSKWKHIKNSMIERLSSILNFKEEDINWLECHESGLKSLVKVTCDLWNNEMKNTSSIITELKLSRTTIIRYLKQGVELGWCDYDPKAENCTKVVCLTTNETFNSIHEALLKYNLKNSNIIQSRCSGKIKSAFFHPETGERMIWMYYEDFIAKTKDEIEFILNNVNGKLLARSKKIICLSTKEIFNTIASASKKYNTSDSSISCCCRKLTFSAGKDLITNDPLVWMYYDEYVLKTEDEIKEILNNKRIPTRFKGEIMCLTTGEIFNDAYEAGIKYNMRADAIVVYCNKDKPNISAGRHPLTGDKLIWMYYEDYILKTKDEIEEILLPSNFVKVICLTNGEIFNSLTEAQRKYKNASHIGHCCKGKAKSSGSLSDGTKLVWMYYKEYLENNK